MPSAAAESSILALRKRLASREESLSKIRTKVKSAKSLAAAKPAKSSISDIQRRYLSAVADLESKGKSSQPLLESRSDAVSSLASKWDQGMEGKKVERTSVTVRGDVRSTQKTFASKDAPKVNDVMKTSKQKSSQPVGPAEIIEEDGDEIPEWAKNQRKLVIRKENARSSVRDVDVRELQGSIRDHDHISNDGSEADHKQVSTSGNVKAALAMWGKTAEEDAMILKKKKEEEVKRMAAAEKARLQKEEEQQRKAEQRALEKFSSMSLNDMTDEPSNEVELIVFLETKIALIEKEIAKAEDELSSYE